ncbi:uncharacterized protein LOC108105540 [Drosophila eugracilis]|uniref:uncharacterized protein LOC108105540 n=1 Tax=Drosophila eugracilis TaxID=29029 RepID=UPI001BD9B255|nr:uncharacterized protein LOC108105540 [Drosophila eugracilis]
MKILYCVAFLASCLTRQTFGQLQSEQPLALLKASGDDSKTPLIMLSNPFAKPTFGTSIKSEQEPETTLMPEAANTLSPVIEAVDASTEKPPKKTRPPQKQKPGFNHGQKQKYPVQDLLLMPGMWETSPIIGHGKLDTLVAQPVFYPIPVYIPYPIPFMLNQQMHLMSTASKEQVEDQISMGFNNMLTENLLESSFQDAGSEWQKIIKNRLRPANLDGQKKWRGKLRKTATTTTTTTTTKAPVSNPTQPTRLQLSSSNQSDSEVTPMETIDSNEPTEVSG